nr:MAG: antirepressor protein KilAC domain [Bacteriophage sp.]
MNTEIQTFNFNNNPVRTLTDENGDPWFVGKGVATILGYANPRKALIDHVDDEDKTDGVTIRDSIGREQNPTVINESGLYSLILSSKLPTAKRFKRWVTHEVLPTIRKTGGYIPASEADSDEDILAKAVLIAQKTIDLKNQQLQAKDAQIKELEPKAKALDAFANVEDRLLIRDAAKILSNAGTPITEKQLREWMADNGWIYKSNCSWHATARHCTAGHLVMVMSQDYVTKADGTKFAYPPTVRITRKGLALLHKRLGETLLADAIETTTH